MFEVGKPVVCIKSYKSPMPGLVYVKGQQFIIRSIHQECCWIGLDLGFKVSYMARFFCDDCPCVVLLREGDTWFADSSHFIPLDEITEIEVLEQPIEIEVFI